MWRIELVQRTPVIRRFIFKPVSTQVEPSRVHSFDQCDLLSAIPLLQLCFASERLRDFPIVLEPDQAIAVVFRTESVAFLPFVLEESSAEITGDADIEGAAAAGYDIGRVEAFGHQGRVFDKRWSGCDGDQCRTIQPMKNNYRFVHSLRSVGMTCILVLSRAAEESNYGSPSASRWSVGMTGICGYFAWFSDTAGAFASSGFFSSFFASLECLLSGSS
jgi:hypothetical protein